MYTCEAVRHFGNKTKLAEALEVTSGYVSQWGDLVPELQAARLEKITQGVLIYEPSLYADSKVA